MDEKGSAQQALMAELSTPGTALSEGANFSIRVLKLGLSALMLKRAHAVHAPSASGAKEGW